MKQPPNRRQILIPEVWAVPLVALQRLDPRRVTDKRVGHKAVHQVHDPCSFESANIRPRSWLDLVACGPARHIIRLSAVTSGLLICPSLVQVEKVVPASRDGDRAVGQMNEYSPLVNLDARPLQLTHLPVRQPPTPNPSPTILRRSQLMNSSVPTDQSSTSVISAGVYGGCGAVRACFL